jgi:hypothetical protein
MRMRLTMAVAGLCLGLGLGVAFDRPAMAGGWGDGYCCAGTVYVHHHAYYPPRYRHIYHVHAPAPRHVNVVDPGCCAPVYSYRAWDHFGSRYYWPWRGRYW